MGANIEIPGERVAAESLVISLRFLQAMFIHTQKWVSRFGLAMDAKASLRIFIWRWAKSQ
jgi:hypothetical protein